MNFVRFKFMDAGSINAPVCMNLRSQTPHLCNKTHMFGQRCFVRDQAPSARADTEATAVDLLGSDS